MSKTYVSEKIKIPVHERQMRAILLRPLSGSGRVGILWLHGGAYMTGFPEMVYFSRALPLVKKYGAVVLAPDYRLSGRAPYPAALEDAYAALCYLKDHAPELGVDTDRLMVGGESAGGGLAAALCIEARRRGDVKIAFQMPLYPMLDDRDTDSSRDNHAFTWNTPLNHFGWRRYLRGLNGAAVPPTAAPARETDYRGLPPAYTFVGRREPFYCETIAYIDNLKAAGVEASCDVYETSEHAFDMLSPLRRISREAAREFERRYIYAAGHFRSPQEEDG